MKDTLDQFFKRLEHLPFYDDLIVEVHYKYKHETQYTVSNEILLYDGDHNDWTWLNDWDEGQSDDPLGVYIAAFVPVSEVETWREMIMFNYKHALGMD